MMKCKININANYEYTILCTVYIGHYTQIHFGHYYLFHCFCCCCYWCWLFVFWRVLCYFFFLVRLRLCSYFIFIYFKLIFIVFVYIVQKSFIHFTYLNVQCTVYRVYTTHIYTHSLVCAQENLCTHRLQCVHTNVYNNIILMLEIGPHNKYIYIIHAAYISLHCGILSGKAKAFFRFILFLSLSISFSLSLTLLLFSSSYSPIFFLFQFGWRSENYFICLYVRTISHPCNWHHWNNERTTE